MGKNRIVKAISFVLSIVIVFLTFTTNVASINLPDIRNFNYTTVMHQTERTCDLIQYADRSSEIKDTELYTAYYNMKNTYNSSWVRTKFYNSISSRKLRDFDSKLNPLEKMFKNVVFSLWAEWEEHGVTEQSFYNTVLIKLVSNGTVEYAERQDNSELINAIEIYIKTKELTGSLKLSPWFKIVLDEAIDAAKELDSALTDRYEYQQGLALAFKAYEYMIQSEGIIDALAEVYRQAVNKYGVAEENSIKSALKAYYDAAVNKDRSLLVSNFAVTYAAKTIIHIGELLIKKGTADLVGEIADGICEGLSEVVSKANDYKAYAEYIFTWINSVPGCWYYCKIFNDTNELFLETLENVQKLCRNNVSVQNGETVLHKTYNSLFKMCMNLVIYEYEYLEKYDQYGYFVNTKKVSTPKQDFVTAIMKFDEDAERHYKEDLAIIKKGLTIKFDLNGGEGDFSSINIPYFNPFKIKGKATPVTQISAPDGCVVRLPKNKPQKNGSAFVGWYCKSLNITLQNGAQLLSPYIINTNSGARLFYLNPCHCGDTLALVAVWEDTVPEDIGVPDITPISVSSDNISLKVGEADYVVIMPIADPGPGSDQIIPTPIDDGAPSPDDPDPDPDPIVPVPVDDGTPDPDPSPIVPVPVDEGAPDSASEPITSANVYERTSKPKSISLTSVNDDLIPTDVGVPCAPVFVEVSNQDVISVEGNLQDGYRITGLSKGDSLVTFYNLLYESVCVVTVEEAPALGDVNMDGRVDARDRQLLARILDGQVTDESSFFFSAADIDNDQSLTWTDFTLLARCLSGWTAVRETYDVCVN